MVRGNVVDCVCCYCTRVDLYWARFNPVDVCCDPEIKVGLRTGDGGTEVIIGGAYLYDGGIVAIDLDYRRR